MRPATLTPEAIVHAKAHDMDPEEVAAHLAKHLEENPRTYVVDFWDRRFVWYLAAPRVRFEARMHADGVLRWHAGGLSHGRVPRS